MPFFGLFKGRSPPAKERSPPARGRSPPDPFDLDKPLVWLSPYDAWTRRHSFEGLKILGAIGSAKTSSSGATIAKALLADRMADGQVGYGGLVLCAKPEERSLWERYARETGREKHLVIVSPENPWRFNFLDYEARREGRGGGLTENIVNLLSIAVQLGEGKVELSGDGAFWHRSMLAMLRCAVDTLVLSGEPLTLEAISRFIAEAPTSIEEVASEAWQNNSYCAQIIRRAEQKNKTVREQHDFETAVRYWLKQFPELSDRTRSGIVATYTSVSDLLSHGLAWELFSTETTFVPDVSWKDGAIILLDLPIQEFGEVGRVCQGLFKTLWQKAVLRRDLSESNRGVFLWADEAQNFISSFDYLYQSTCRSSRACTVFLTQNVPNVRAVLGRGSSDEANSFLGNMVTTIFHAQSDPVTNQYAADLISQEITTNYSFSSGSSLSGMNHSSGGSETLRYKVLPSEFTRLRKGGPEAGFVADAIVFGGGRVFRASGDTYLRTTFKQS